jgi:CO/xanthine dehydrogenase Mo-binding subunit
VIVEEHNPLGPYGAKGVGEPPVIPVAAAIANAVYDAVGVRCRDLPIIPERILRELSQGEKNGAIQKRVY